MKSAITINDIFDAIEVELLQGSVAQDDLGFALQRIRHYQSQVRSELLANQKTPVLQDVVSRQFQINDMLLALFHAVIGKQQQQQIDLRKSLLWATQRPAPTNVLPNEDLSSADLSSEDLSSEDLANAALADPSLADKLSTAAEQATVALNWRTVTLSTAQLATIDPAQIDKIKAAMKEDMLILPMDVRQGGPPVIGPIIARLRTLFHSLAIFYSNRLASRQASVNQLWGDQLLTLHELSQQQNLAIAALHRQMTALQSMTEQSKESQP